MDKKDRNAKTADKDFLEDELSRVLESSSIPTCVISRDHIVIHWNAAMEALTGVRKKDIISTNKQWSTFYAAERPILADLIIARTPDEEIERMYKGKYKRSSLIEGAYEGSDFFSAMGVKGKWLEYTAAPLKNAKGEIIGALETARDIGEEKEAEQKLRESENSYRTLISNIAGAAYRCTLDKRAPDKPRTMSFLSSGIKDLSGYEASEFLNNAVRSFTSIIHPDDRKKIEDQIEATIKKKAPYTLEYRIMHRNGSIRWVYEKGQAIYEDDSVLWLDGIIYDMQEQKEVEQRLLESEEKYRTVVEASSQNISIVSKEGVFKFMNIAAASALKGRPEDLIGKSMYELFPKETADSHMRAIGAAINSGNFLKAESSDILRGERKWYDTSIQPLKNRSGEYDSALIIANEITKRKLYEEEIKHLKEFSDNIVESTPVGIIVVDKEKRITACNKAEENLFGTNKKDLMGKVLYEDYLGNIADVMEPQLDNTLKTGKTAKRPGVEYRDESGRNNILDISISPLFSGTQITGAVVTTDDVTEKKKLKERVRIFEKKEFSLTDKDKLVLHGLIANPDLNDIELARKVRMKRSTLTGIKNKLARTGFYITVMVPNLPLLGYELLTIN